MSHFEGLSADVLGIGARRAEACAEAEGETWIRDATEEEQQLFKDHCLGYLMKRMRATNRSDLTSASFWLMAMVVLSGLKPCSTNQIRQPPHASKFSDSPGCFASHRTDKSQSSNTD